MNQMVKFGIILALICLTATLVLAVTYEVTKPKIDEAMKGEEKKALELILPDADTFSEKTKDGIDYYEAFKGKELIGYCVKVVSNGYNGFIRIIAGIDLNGVITGVEVIEHSETPGLGAKINEIKPGEKSPWFLKQFAGKPASEIEVGKNIDAITGATVSSKAVTEAVNKTVSEFLKRIR